jgi:hypothetical protein
MGNSIPHANLRLIEIKDLAELASAKAGSNSLLLKNFPGDLLPLPARSDFCTEYYFAVITARGYATNRLTAIT